MKKVAFLLFTIHFSLLTFLLSSCGNGPGAPGSSGSEKTGIEITSVSSSPISTAADLGPDIDVNVHLCPSGQPEPGLFRVDATLTITARILNSGSSFDPFPASVEECTITYLRDVSDPPGPVIQQWSIFPNCPIISGTNSCVVDLIDIPRKVDFWNALNSGVYDATIQPRHYQAAFNCKYVNRVGESGTFEIEQRMNLADFNKC